MSNEYLQMFASFGAVIILLLCCLWVIKKIKMNGFKKYKHINLIHVQHIGAKERILLVEVHKTRMLLGATPNNISTLHVFDDVAESNLAEPTITFREKMGELS